MGKFFHIILPLAAALCSSCATQRYVRSDVVRTFAPTVTPEEVCVYEKMSEVPSEAILIGEVEARSPAHNRQSYVEQLICNETAANGGNGVFVVFNEPSLRTTTLHTGNGVMFLLPDSLVTPPKESFGRQFVAYLDERQAAKLLPPNLFYFSVGQDLWGHKLTMPDGKSISPSGIDFVAGYDRLITGNSFYGGVQCSMHRTYFTYNEVPCGIDLFNLVPHLSLRYRSGKRFAWAADGGIGYSLCRQRLTENQQFELNGVAYLLGIECGYLFTQYTMLTVGYSLLGDIYLQGSQRIQRYDIRVGINFLF